VGYGLVSDDLIIVGKSKSKRVRPPSNRFLSVGKWESGLVVEFDWRKGAMTGECAVEGDVSGDENECVGVECVLQTGRKILLKRPRSRPRPGR